MALRMSARDAAALQKKPKRSKYGAKRVEIDGITFASRAEGDRYLALRALQRQGRIDQLEVHPRFELVKAVKLDGKTKPAIRYEADFSYVDTATESVVVEDVKGFVTQAYRMKRHMMKALLGIEIVEVKAR